MKFLYIADTHIGGKDGIGYIQQPRYLSKLDSIMQSFKDYIDDSGDVDFVIHGGDMVDEGNEANIKFAREIFGNLPCPVYLALGNHDLSEEDSLNKWLELAPEFFQNGMVDFSFEHGGVNFDFLSCHWGSKPYFWNQNEPQVPYFEESQLGSLNKTSGSKRRILVTHAPVMGLPCEQTGFAEEIHPSAGDFKEIIFRTVRVNSFECVLGAHTHMNMHIEKEGVHYVTASALPEAPFEFKEFEILEGLFSMKTVNLADKAGFKYDYDFGKTYTQGRNCDRSFEENR